jgi:hypothetical protein
VEYFLYSVKYEKSRHLKTAFSNFIFLILVSTSPSFEILSMDLKSSSVEVNW